METATVIPHLLGIHIFNNIAASRTGLATRERRLCLLGGKDASSRAVYDDWERALVGADGWTGDKIGGAFHVRRVQTLKWRSSRSVTYSACQHLPNVRGSKYEKNYYT